MMNLRRPAAEAVLLAVAVACLATPCLANPIDMNTVKRLNALPFIIVRGGTPAEEAEYVRQLVRYSPDQPLIYFKATRDLVDSNYPKLKRYFFEAQTLDLDEGIQARVRSMGDEADRKQMCDLLLVWLRDRPGPDPEVVVLESPKAHPQRVFRVDGGVRKQQESRTIRVAEFLADWQDTRALPLVDSLASDSTLSEYSRGSLALSARRLRDPCAFGFLAPDGHGGVRFCRKESDLASMKFIRPESKAADCVRPLDASRIASLWAHLQSSREGPHAKWFGGGWSLRLEFRDGLVVDLEPTDAGWFNYDDSGRSEGWHMTVQNPHLFDAIKDCLPARTRPKYYEGP